MTAGRHFSPSSSGEDTTSGLCPDTACPVEINSLLRPDAVACTDPFAGATAATFGWQTLRVPCACAPRWCNRELFNDIAWGRVTQRELLRGPTVNKSSGGSQATPVLQSIFSKKLDPARVTGSRPAVILAQRRRGAGIMGSISGELQLRRLRVAPPTPRAASRQPLTVSE